MRRVRKMVKWAGVVVCLVTAAAWWCSRSHAMGFIQQPFGFPDQIPSDATGFALADVRILRGRLVVMATFAASVFDDDSKWERFYYSTSEYELLWGFSLRNTGANLGEFTIVAIPLWAILLLSAMPTAYLFWRDRRVPVGHCGNCRYNLEGNVSGVCPECGTQVVNESAVTDS